MMHLKIFSSGGNSLKFQIFELHWWYTPLVTFGAFIIGDGFLGSLFKRQALDLFALLAFVLLWFAVVWFGVLWRWNLRHPFYVTLEEHGMYVGKEYYDADEVEGILIIKRKPHTIFVSLKRRIYRIQLIPWKASWDVMHQSFDQSAGQHGIPVFH